MQNFKNLFLLLLLPGQQKRGSAVTASGAVGLAAPCRRVAGHLAVCRGPHADHWTCSATPAGWTHRRPLPDAASAPRVRRDPTARNPPGGISPEAAPLNNQWEEAPHPAALVGVPEPPAPQTLEGRTNVAAAPAGMGMPTAHELCGVGRSPCPASVKTRHVASGRGPTPETAREPSGPPRPPPAHARRRCERTCPSRRRRRQAVLGQGSCS